MMYMCVYVRCTNMKESLPPSSLTGFYKYSYDSMKFTSSVYHSLTLYQILRSRNPSQPVLLHAIPDWPRPARGHYRGLAHVPPALHPMAR